MDFPAEPTIQLDSPIPLKKLAVVASVAAASQYSWALQYALFTPYAQILGVNHLWVSMLWLCGPISGLIVQPIAGQFSDHCTSRFGRRRPYIVGGAIMLCIGVFLIAFAADMGRYLGDSLTRQTKPHAIAVLLIGFWLLDISNNMIQGPCRALLADIANYNDATITIGNALFSFFMAVGNILGYAFGSYGKFHRIIPFVETEACDKYCANLKTCFLICILLMVIIVTHMAVVIKEERLDPVILKFSLEKCSPDEKQPSLLMQILVATKSQPRETRTLYAVTALTAIGFFPFVLYDTDWMGKEVYGGDPKGDSVQVSMYDDGVRTGSLALVLYVLTTGVASLYMERLVRLCGSIKRVWGIGNFILAFGMAMTVVITQMAKSARNNVAITQGYSPPNYAITSSSFALFTSLGLPLAVAYSIPFALASIYTKEGTTGQGLALGLLNLSIVIPQIAVALIIGPLDSLFGGSNLPSFLLGGVAAAIGGFVSLYMLPDEH